MNAVRLMIGEALTTQRLTTANFLREFFWCGLKWGNPKSIKGLQKSLTVDACNFGSFGLGNHQDLRMKAIRRVC